MLRSPNEDNLGKRDNMYCNAIQYSSEVLLVAGKRRFPTMQSNCFSSADIYEVP